jgi:membrane protein YqaA with SNARE-associated domain
MSSTFAIAFIFITLYSNIAGLLGGALGYYFGKWLKKKNITS